MIERLAHTTNSGEMLRKPGNDGQTVDTPSLGQTKLPQWAGNLSPFYPEDMLSMFTMLTKVNHSKHWQNRTFVCGEFWPGGARANGHTRAINQELISPLRPDYINQRESIT